MAKRRRDKSTKITRIKGVRNLKLCEEMAARIRKLPEVIPAFDMGREQAYLWAYPFLMEAYIMERATERDLDSDEKSKLCDLRGKIRDVGSLKDMLVFDIKKPRDYRVSVFKKGGEKGFTQEIKTVHTCWEDEYEEKAAELYEDLKIGGSIVLFGERKRRKNAGYKQKVFSRSNICIGADKELILFVDTIENGNTGTASISGWDKRKKELTMITTGWMYVARQLGINTLGLGEIEIYELGRRLGVQTRKLFKNSSSSDSKEKIAHKRKIGKKVYCWKLGEKHDGRYYAMDLGLAHDLSKRRMYASDKADLFKNYAGALEGARGALEEVNEFYRG